MLRLRATDAAGQVVRDEPVPHGADPVAMLRGAGWRPAFDGGSREGQDVVLRFEVAPGPTPHVHQRVAGYAVVLARVEGRRSVLLTQLVRTARDGWWTLPGGGLDPGEQPEDGVLREVLEETGQTVVRLRPLDLVSSHWTGPAPSGRLEDFHAVRLVYVAECPAPGRPVVHDVDGTTAAAAWVPLEELRGLPVVDWTLPLIRRVADG